MNLLKKFDPTFLFLFEVLHYTTCLCVVWWTLFIVLSLVNLPLAIAAPDAITRFTTTTAATTTATTTTNKRVAYAGSSMIPEAVTV